MIPLLLALAGCAETNSPPVFLAVNDLEVYSTLTGTSLEGRLNVAAGEVLDLRVEVEDPDLDPVMLWWPGAPQGFTWEDGTLYAAWLVPEDFWDEQWDQTVIAEDDLGAAAALTIPISVAGLTE